MSGMRVSFKGKERRMGRKEREKLAESREGRKWNGGWND